MQRLHHLSESFLHAFNSIESTTKKKKKLKMIRMIFFIALCVHVATTMQMEPCVPSYSDVLLAARDNDAPAPPPSQVQLFAIDLRGIQWSNTSTQVSALNGSSGAAQVLKNMSISESFGSYPPVAAAYDERTRRLYLVDVESNFWRVEMNLAPAAELVRQIHVELLRGVAISGLSASSEVDRLYFVGGGQATSRSSDDGVVAVANSMALFVVDLPFGAAQLVVDLQAAPNEIVLANAPSAFAATQNRYYYVSMEQSEHSSRAVVRNVRLADSTFARAPIDAMRFVSMLAWDDEWRTLVGFGGVIVDDGNPLGGQVQLAFVRIDPAQNYNVTALEHVPAADAASASFAYTYNSALHAFIYVHRRDQINYATTVGLDANEPYLQTVVIDSQHAIHEYFAFIALNS
jgi:hypothetical protein